MAIRIEDSMVLEKDPEKSKLSVNNGACLTFARYNMPGIRGNNLISGISFLVLCDSKDMANLQDPESEAPFVTLSPDQARTFMKKVRAGGLDSFVERPSGYPMAQDGEHYSLVPPLTLEDNDNAISRAELAPGIVVESVRGLSSSGDLSAEPITWVRIGYRGEEEHISTKLPSLILSDREWHAALEGMKGGDFDEQFAFPEPLDSSAIGAPAVAAMMEQVA